MDERRLESASDTARRQAGHLAGDGQDMASRAVAYAQQQAQQMAQRAGAYAGDLKAQVERLTGRSADAWTRDARRYVQSHPLRAVAITIGLGFLLGKLLARD